MNTITLVKIAVASESPRFFRIPDATAETVPATMNTTDVSMTNMLLCWMMFMRSITIPSRMLRRLTHVMPFMFDCSRFSS